MNRVIYGWEISEYGYYSANETLECPVYVGRGAKAFQPPLLQLVPTSRSEPGWQSSPE